MILFICLLALFLPPYKLFCTGFVLTGLSFSLIQEVFMDFIYIIRNNWGWEHLEINCMTHFSILCTVKACILFQWPLELLFWTVLLSLHLKRAHLFYPLLPPNKFKALKIWGRVVSLLMCGLHLAKDNFLHCSLYSSISRLPVQPGRNWFLVSPGESRCIMLAAAAWCFKGVCVESFLGAAVCTGLSEWSSELMNEHSCLKQTYISFKLDSFISVAHLSPLVQSKVNP